MFPGSDIGAASCTREVDSNVRLLNRFYAIFTGACITLLAIGVPVFFVRKTGSAIVALVLLAAVLSAWRVNVKGNPQSSLKLFSVFALIIGITALYLGVAQTIVVFIIAIAVILAVVVNLRTGIVFGGVYLLAWLVYVLLGLNGIAPPPYFVGGPVASWFHGVVALLLVLLPVPELVATMRAAVGERDRAELHLRESLLFNEAILQQSPVAMGVYEVNGSCIMANQAYAQLIGTTVAQVMAQSFDTIVAWKASGIHADILAALHDGQTRRRSTPVTTLTGKDLWVDAIMMPMVLHSQTHLLIQFLDQTAQRRSEENLRKSEERLALALDASALSMWDFDIDTRIVSMDAQWAQIVGGPAGPCAVPFETLWRATHRGDIERVAKATYDCFKQIHESFNEEFRYLTLGGEWKWLRCSGKVIERDRLGRGVRAIGTNLDITARKVAEEQIRQLAYYDSLTGLPNRRMLLDRLNHALAQARRNARLLAVMFLDLDNFKTVNDTFGHDTGDNLLKEVAARLGPCIRAGDTLSRQGGDEFVIILTEMRVPADAPAVAEKIFAALSAPIRLAERDILITTSIGISLFPTRGTDDAIALLKKADSAMYEAKNAGRNGYRIFEAPTAPSQGAAAGSAASAASA